MKKVLLNLIPAAGLIIAVTLFFSSCEKKDPTYNVVITVKYLSDTTQVVKGASVLIEKNDVRMTGITDNGGTYSATFKLEAILNVHASIDTGDVSTPVHFYGSSTIRLLEDKTVHRTVFVNP